MSLETLEPGFKIQNAFTVMAAERIQRNRTFIANWSELLFSEWDTLLPGSNSRAVLLGPKVV